MRTSPSGMPPGRTKKPPTSASCTPRAAHHGASFCGLRRIATRSSVLRSGWEVAYTVVAAPPGSATRARVEAPAGLLAWECDAHGVSVLAQADSHVKML